ncbi:hypothetical protein WHI96_21355 [Pseudonocardia tropica]|uniref:DUF222 domain-containing protein n=1 Tax=Pseudonocardia tropica TaxID=681289 RepID=A0ABV1JZI7_9PSEU
MDDLTEDQRRVAAGCVDRLFEADEAYEAAVSEHYDEVVHEVIERVGTSGSVGKLDIAALTAWKRVRADTKWVAGLMNTSDADVRRRTSGVVEIVNDRVLAAPEAAGRARSALSPLSGFGTGDALASAVCFAAAPGRMAVYDKRSHAAVLSLGFELDNRRGRYRRYMTIVEACRSALHERGHKWEARQVDTALYYLGGPDGGTED